MALALHSTPEPKVRKPRAKAADRGEFVIGEIEDDVPMPGRGKGDDIPFSEMNVGQSLLIGGLSSSGVHSAAKRYAAGRPGNPPQFIVRDTGHGVRVWRTK